MSILIYLATIFWSLFPNLIHVFQGGDDFINKVNESNLVSNSDLRLDDNSDGVPDGFSLSSVASSSLDDGVLTYTASYQYGGIRIILPPDNESLYYIYANTKADIEHNIEIRSNVGSTFNFNRSVPPSPDFVFSSWTILIDTTQELRYSVIDVRPNGSSFTPISVDFIGAYNVSVMKLNGVKNDDGILFSDLTNEEIRLQLDTWINDFGDLSFTITKDNTSDKWFNTGFVDKTAERDFLDYLGYFVWLMTPPIMLFITLDLIRRLL